MRLSRRKMKISLSEFVLILLKVVYVLSNMCCNRLYLKKEGRSDFKSLIKYVHKNVENQESPGCVLHNLTRKYRLGKSIDPAQTVWLTMSFSFPDSNVIHDCIVLR